jgi:hypothetical protein
MGRLAFRDSIEQTSFIGPTMPRMQIQDRAVLEREFPQEGLIGRFHWPGSPRELSRVVGADGHACQQPAFFTVRHRPSVLQSMQRSGCIPLPSGKRAETLRQGGYIQTCQGGPARLLRPGAPSARQRGQMRIA